MQSESIAMTWDEFERMPRRLGWKHEYWDGHAHLSPRHHAVVTTVTVTPREIPGGWALRPVRREDQAKLVSAYFTAFADTVEYCNRTADQVEAAARENIETYFKGQRGTPSASSRVSLATPGRPEEIVGAALVVEIGEGLPVLDLLFVQPAWHRRGAATAMVAGVLLALCQAGKTTLRSCYDLANDSSRTWHQRFGFVEAPDLSLARHLEFHARCELRRRDLAGDVSEKERAGLVSECARHALQVAALAELARREGYEAVTPLLGHP